MNERADEQAELGRLDDLPEICPGPQKYGSFWLRVRPTVRELAEKCGKQLPRDSAPNCSLLEKTVASNTLRAVKKRTTHFVTDLLHHKVGSIVSRTIRRCAPAEYRVWLRCMTGIYPVQTYLARIGVVKSSICPHCTEQTPETLTHFACVCPKFREARTSAHNQVRTVITSFLVSTLRSEWTIFEETPMGRTGLTLRPTSQASLEQLNRRQPDWVLVSSAAKKIAIVDLSRPSDVYPDQLMAAAVRKQQSYSCLEEALSAYIDQGWVVHVFPWVVGIRGMMDPLHVESLLKFLSIPRKHWPGVLERTVIASVRAFHFLHRVRFGGLAELQRSELDSEHSDADSSDNVKGVGAKRKPRRREAEDAQNYTDSDSSAADDLMEQPRSLSRLRSTTVATTASTAKLPTAREAGTTAPRQVSPLVRRAPALPRTRGKKTTQQTNKAGRAKPRLMRVAGRGSVLSVRGKVRICGQQQLKRKRWGRANVTDTFDTDDPDQRPIKQQRKAPEDPPDLTTLWTRWRKMEPQKRWRT